MEISRCSVYRNNDIVEHGKMNKIWGKYFGLSGKIWIKPDLLNKLHYLE